MVRDDANESSRGGRWGGSGGNEPSNTSIRLVDAFYCRFVIFSQYCESTLQLTSRRAARINHFGSRLHSPALSHASATDATHHPPTTEISLGFPHHTGASRCALPNDACQTPEQADEVALHQCGQFIDRNAAYLRDLLIRGQQVYWVI